jgi:hypothetical protein
VVQVNSDLGPNVVINGVGFNPSAESKVKIHFDQAICSPTEISDIQIKCELQVENYQSYSTSNAESEGGWGLH